MKALILTVSLFAGAVFACFGQKKSVVIGSMIDKPNAILVINPPNSDQGFLLPQLNTTERLSIAPSSPDDDGLMVFDVTEKSFYYWSSNAWIKGLGDATSQVLSYDAATQVLTLSGGGTVNLTTLKEIPSLTGNAGKFLTTDGTTLSWADINTIGDISSVTAGAGLTGGATTGDVNLAVNIDDASININGSNQLQIKDAGVTTQKVAPQAITNAQIANETILSGNILNGTIASADLGDQSVTPQKIQPSGTDNQVLITIGGTVAWADQSALPVNVAVDNPLTGDGSAGNHVRILNDGINETHIAANAVTASELADGAVDENAIATNAVTTNKILDGAITELKLGTNSVTPTKIQPGANNQVLVTNGAGTTAWVNQSSIIPALVTDAATIAGNGTTVPLAVGIITGANINDNTISGAKVTDATLTPTKIQPGAANQVMVTNGGGNVQWVNASTLAQPVTADGATITGDGTLGNPLQVGTINSGNITDGTIIADDIGASQVTTDKIADDAVSTAKIQLDAITTNQLGPDAVTTLDIQDKAVIPGKIQNGAANQVLVTNSAGNGVVWTNQSNLVPNISVSNPTITGDGTAGNPIAVGTISSVNIPDNTIVLADMDDNSVSTSELTNLAVTNAKLGADAVTSPKIADGTIQDVDLDVNAVSTAKIQDGAVTPLKIDHGTANQVLVTNGAGNAVQWTDQSNFVPNIAVSNPTITGDGTAGNPLAVGTISSANIPDNTIVLNDMSDNSVGTDEIVNSSVTTQKIQSGTANQVLITNATGTGTEWTDQSNLVPNITVSNPTITGDGTAGNPLAVGTISSANIPDNTIVLNDMSDNSVGTDEIVNSSVTPQKIQSGTANQVFVTNATGTGTEWTDQSNLVPNIAVSNPSITGNGTVGNPLAVGTISSLNIPDNTIVLADMDDNSVSTAELTDLAVTTAKLDANAVISAKIADGTIQDADLDVDAVSTAKIQDGAVTLPKIDHGTANQVLVTNGAGNAVQWTDQSNLVPNIAVSNPTITGDGTSGNPLAVGTISSGNIPDNTIVLNDMTDGSVGTSELVDLAVTTIKLDAGAVTNPKLGTGAVTTDKILDGDVRTADLQDDAVTPAKIQQGTANQILATDGTGTNTLWIDRGTLPSAGDVTGTLAATTVARIQGRDVSNAAPTNGQALIWNNTNSRWEPSTVTVSPTAQFYSIDPSDFEGLEPNGGSNETTLGLFQADNTFVTDNGPGRQIMAPIHLPQGATITSITVFCEDNVLVLDNMTISVLRKGLAGGSNENLSSATTSILAIGLQSLVMPGITGGAEVIDNSVYSYRIHVVFSHLLDFTTAASSTQRIHGIRIAYTK